MGESGWNPSSGKDPFSASPSRSEEQTGNRRLILIVEDNPADVFLIRAAIQNANIPSELRVVKDGEEAINFIDQVENDQQSRSPDLVILDINLPRRHGGEVLDHMRKSRRLGAAPVLAVSTSDSARDREQMTKLGANVYFRKPSDYSGFMRLGEVIKQLLSGGSAPPAGA